VTDEEFAELAAQYIAAPEVRLTLIKPVLPVTPAALANYRDVADHEWELGLAWDEELMQSVEG
jgi:hypothetical protein